MASNKFEDEVYRAFTEDLYKDAFQLLTDWQNVVAVAQANAADRNDSSGVLS